ncbi:hypothetical protein BC831DRAFT_181003 [Entophlyctis helioformis]|nr:hypothetical protein BC831DRAFT_181003 [Entophlyctis helioformis]
MDVSARPYRCIKVAPSGTANSAFGSSVASMPRFWLLAAAKTFVSANCRVRFGMLKELEDAALERGIGCNAMHHDAGIAGIVEARELDKKLVNVFEKHHQYFMAARFRLDGKGRDVVVKSSWNETCPNQGEARHLDAYDAFTRAICELDKWQQRMYLVLLVHQCHAFE